MKKIYLENIDGWTYIVNPDSKNKRTDITGKYLWFSSNKQSLISMAEDILVKYGLLCAKVPQSDIPSNDSFILCVYDSSLKLKHELAKYSDDVILYR